MSSRAAAASSGSSGRSSRHSRYAQELYEQQFARRFHERMQSERAELVNLRRQRNEEFAMRHNRLKALQDLQTQIAEISYRRPPRASETLAATRRGLHIEKYTTMFDEGQLPDEEMKRRMAAIARTRALQRTRQLKSDTYGTSSVDGKGGRGSGKASGQAGDGSAAQRASAASAVDPMLDEKLAKVMENLQKQREMSISRQRERAEAETVRRSIQIKAKTPLQIAQERRVQAAIKIQATWRGYSVRKSSSGMINKLAKRHRVAREILETELKYVSDLKLVVELFLRPLREEKKNLIKESEVRAIFGNIEELVRVNMTILEDLKRKLANWGPSSTIAPVFVQTAPFLKSYMPYCSNYQQAIGSLSKLRKRDDVLEFIESAESDPRCGGLQLSSFLITPVQRIPRYELLLKEILKSTSPDHADYPMLHEALQAIKEIAEFVNEGIRTSERTNRVFRIQQILSGYDMLIQPGRVSLKEGAVTEYRTGQDKRPRQLFLFNDILIVATKKRLTFMEDKFAFKYLVDLRQADVDPTGTPDLPNSFRVQWDSHTVYFGAESQAQRTEWAATMQKAITSLRRRTATVNSRSFAASLASQLASASNSSRTPSTGTPVTPMAPATPVSSASS